MIIEMMSSPTFSDANAFNVTFTPYNYANATFNETTTSDERLQSAKSMLLLMSLVVSVIVAGCYFFAIWDARDHDKFVYQKSDKKESTLNTLVEKVANGYEADTFRKTDKAATLKERLLCCWKSKDNVKDKYNVRKPMRSEFRHELEDFNDMWRSNIIGESQEDDELEIDDDSIMGRKVVLKYINAALPIRPLLIKEGNRFIRFLTLIIKQHSYISMFFHRSPGITRTMRWVHMWRGILVLMFVDTLFIEIVYPDNNTCPSLNSITSCKDIASKVSARQSLCSWNYVAQTCSLVPPPRSMHFILIVLLFCLAVSLPINIALSYLLDNFAAKRPRLSQWYLHGNSWLGSTYHTMLMGNVHHESAIQRWQSSQEMKLSTNEVLKNGHLMYQSYSSVEEELSYLLDKTRRFFFQGGDALTTNKQCTADAIAKALNILPTGEPGPLTLLQMIRYGNGFNQMKHRLERLRREEQVVLRRFNNCESHNKDLVLLHAFILEQVSFFKRFALRHHLRVADVITPPEINLYVWLLVWLLLIGLFGFFGYWEFNWALNIGTKTLHLWGYIFFIALVEDICLCQLFRIFMIHIFALEFSRKQLQNIYRTLVRVALTCTSANYVLRERHFGSSRDAEFNVVQHLSPSCRAARSNDAFRLPSSFVLRHITDVDVTRCREFRDKGRVFKTFVIVPAYLSALQSAISDRILELLLASILTGLLLSLKLIHKELGLVYVAIPVVIGVILVLRFAYIRLYQHKKALDRVFANRLALSKRKKNMKLHSSPLRSLLTKLFNRFAMLWRGEYRKNPKLRLMTIQWKQINAANHISSSADYKRIHINSKNNNNNNNNSSNSLNNHSSEDIADLLCLSSKEYSELCIPREIHDMIPRVRMKEVTTLHDRLQRKLFDAVKMSKVIELENLNYDVEDENDDYDQHILSDSLDHSTREVVSFRSNSNISSVILRNNSTNEVLTRIRLDSPIANQLEAIKFLFKYILGRDRIVLEDTFLSWFQFAKENDRQIPPDLIRECVSNIWRVYVPMGFKLTEEEITELDDLFVDWIKKRNNLGIMQAANVLLSDLVEWMILVLDWINRQRISMFPREPSLLRRQ